MKRTEKDLIVVRVDGGICSQINFIALGYAVGKALGGKVRVKYDLSWFRDNGKDFNGRFVRNWDFPATFPDLPVEEATEEEIAAVKRRRALDCSEISDLAYITAPAYLEGYPKGCFNRPGCRELFSKGFRPALDAASAAVADEIAAGPACAVHVRRGDLSVASLAYGVPCSPKYFSKAIKIVRALEPKVKFYFFSDEPDYVRNELLPALPPDVNGRIVQGNGSDKGYLDLALISKCGYVVASIGSLGIYGAFLGGGTLVTPKYSLECLQAMDNVIYLNEDRELIALRQRKDERRSVFPGIVKISSGRKRALLLFNRFKFVYR